MIGQIIGKISWLGEKSVLVLTGNVGYKIYIGAPTMAKLKINENFSFFTYLAVRENALDLYGFLEKPELDFFEMLINISGIGPKSAQSIMAIASLETLKKAIAAGDASYLTKVSGIGKKIAEKIILELRDKLSTLGHKAEVGELSGELDAIEALKSLGYSQTEAREALKKIDPSIKDLGQKIKEVLKILSTK